MDELRLYALTILSASALGTAFAWAQTAPAFKHIVVIVQENRTPDNLFGSNPTFEPGVDLATSGIDSKGNTIPLTAEPIADCYDIKHTHASFALALSAGFDQEPLQVPTGCVAPANPQFKYVDNSTGTVQPYFDIAASYGFANRMFQTNQGPSFPAHQFLFGGTSQPKVDSPLFAAENVTTEKQAAGCIAPKGQLVAVIDGFGRETSNAPIFPCFEHRTLPDLLAAAKPAPITWRYYAPTPGSIWTAPNAIRHICVPGTVNGTTACTGAGFTNGQIVDTNPAQVLTDIATCKLQGVSWVIPTGLASDHPQLTDGTGPAWVAAVVNAVGTQPACTNGDTYWSDTAIIITWDDWGGWYDHVAPFQLNRQPTTQAGWGDGYTYGFRVPMLVVSAYTPAGTVSNTVHDFGSILYFIEHNFGLGFIGGKDMTTYGQFADYHNKANGWLSEFFTLTQPRSFAPLAAKLGAASFIQAPHALQGPDND